MTGTAYPGDAVAGVPAYTSTMGRSAFAAAMGGATAARPLGGITGLRPGTPSTIFTVTSTTWTLTPFGGYIDLESPATTGGYFFSFQANETGSVTAAAGSARVDLVWVQINDSNTGDGSGLSPRVVTGYQAGVAGAGVPTLTAVRAFVIAQINVPASGGGSPTFSWVAPSTVAAGGILPVATQATLNATAGTLGQYAAVTSDAIPANNNLYRWSGSVWKTTGAVATSQAYAGAGLANGASFGTVSVTQQAFAQTVILSLVGAITASAATTAAVGISVGAGGTLLHSTTVQVPVGTAQQRDGAGGTITIAAGSGTTTITMFASVTTGANIAVAGELTILTSAS